MYRILLIISVIFFTGCVSADKYQSLENKYNTLNAKYSLLEKEIKDLKQTADFYYKSGINYYRNKEYDRALESFNIVIAKYPKDKLVGPSKAKISEIKSIPDNNYKKILSGIKAIDTPKGKVDFINSEIKKYYLTENHISRLKKKLDYYGQLIPPVDVFNYKIIKSYKNYRDIVQFLVQFQNNTGKEIVGIAYHYTFFDSFKNILYENNAEFSIKISPYGKNPMDVYTYWVDNQFISDEVYDRLSIPVSEGTIKATIEITKVIFEDDTIWDKK